MLTVGKKKLVRDAIRYYIDSVGESAEQFILTVQRNFTKNIETLDYKAWLAVKIYDLLKSQDITLADCLEFRNLATQLKLERKGMNVTTAWKKEIAKVIDSTGISRFELFDVSETNSEFKYIEGIEKEINCLDNEEFNFFNTFDFDLNNRTFLNELPKKVQSAILYNLPIFFNLNPYIEYKKDLDLIFDEMKLYGLGKKKLQNIHFASLFRIMRLCEEYSLTDVRIGFFTPLDMYYEKEEYSSFYKELKSKFKFNTGICFSPKSVGVNEKSELIGYMIWDMKKEDERDVPVVLNERIQHTDETILSGTDRLLRGHRESLYDWLVSGSMKVGEASRVPIYQNLQNKSEDYVDRYSNVLGYQLNSKNVSRSLMKIGIYSVPFVSEHTEITVENFYKSVASFVVRSVLGDSIKGNTPTSLDYLSSPDMTVEGYQNWVADSIIYFVFNPLNMTKSYREKDVILPNRMYPFAFSDVRRYVKDDNVIDDMNKSEVQNSKFVEIIENAVSDLSEVGASLYNFCKKKMFESLMDKNRENAGYKNSLVAWDASFYQIRGMQNIFSSEDEETYNYLLSQLKEKLVEGVYKFGFVSEKK